jgi:hypothetical protein
MTADRLRTSPDVRASTSRDGLILLDVRRGLVLAANPVGARIWQLLEQQRTRHEIAEQLAAEYGVPPERARCDVAAFAADLLARGLVVEDSPC